MTFIFGSNSDSNPDPDSKGSQSEQTLGPIEELVKWVGEGIHTALTQYAIPVTGTIATVIAGGVGYYAAVEAARIQANATIEASNDPSQQREIILSKFTERVQGLFADNNFSDVDRRLIQAQSFSTLRTQDEQGKGFLVRFLDEYQLIKANQPGVSLSGADLQKVKLQNAWLPDINLQGAYLTGGDLSKTNLKRANLKGANFKGANLAGADLAGVNLADADLTDANLLGANLLGANLKGARLCNTTMPDGSIVNCQ